MTDEQLQAWIEQISLRSFGVPFRHQARFNSRLRTTGGRYFMKSHHIEINPAQLVTYGEEEVERIIKHELCHYHLHLAGRGYQHRDADFKALLQSRRQPVLPFFTREQATEGLTAPLQAGVRGLRDGVSAETPRRSEPVPLREMRRPTAPIYVIRRLRMCYT